jgi:GT2 family glycosyltransferase
LNDTKGLLGCLKAQDYQPLHIVIVDDGSSDGTASYLRDQAPEVEVIEGDGSLWWGGAMAKGLSNILPRTQSGDYVLFLNNDVHIESNFISRLVAASREFGGAVVGSILLDVERPERILSIGPRISYELTRCVEVYQTDEAKGGDGSGSLDTLPTVIELDALSGRGTLYPAEVLLKIGNVRYRWLPHYWGDYEISARAKAAGFKILVATRARVWSREEPSGLDPRSASIVGRCFSRRSQTNILHTIVFFSLCGPWYCRVTALPRVFLLRLYSLLMCRLAFPFWKLITRNKDGQRPIFQMRMWKF